MKVVKVHPTAFVDPTAELGEDVVIGPQCVVEYNAKIGDRSVLQYRAMVRRWTELGANNTLLPGAILGGDPQHLAYRDEETWLRVGDGNWFGEYVTIHRGSNPGSDTVIGNFNFFMAYSHVGHDCHIGNSVVMTNYSGLAGHSTIEDSVLIAGYAGTHQHVRVGTMAMLGGGALCGQDVAPYMIVTGVPAQPRGLNTVGLQRNGVSEQARQALNEAYKILFLQQRNLESALAEIRAKLPDLPEIQHLLSFIEQSERGIARRKKQ